MILSILQWQKKTSAIIEKVDDETLTPTDQTLEVYNIPEFANKEEVAGFCENLYPGHIQDVYLVKKLDERIETFHNLVEKAKVLKNLRSQ